MPDRIKKAAKALSERGGIFMFIRAQFSSQIASATDFLVTILLAKIFSLYYVYATLTGSVCGGIVNCFVNYKWTFKNREGKKSHIIVKYISVWIGSILLNTWGIYLMTESLAKSPWIQEILSHYFDDLFLLSKIVVSLLVGFGWNYNMQRIFVYRNYDIKYFHRKRIEYKNKRVENEIQRLGTTNDL